MKKLESCSKNSNSDNASFLLTARLCDPPNCLDDSEIAEDSGWVFNDLRKGSALTTRQDIVVCQGLSQLKMLLEEIDDETCLYPGLPVPSSILEAQNEIPPSEDLEERFWSELLGLDSETGFISPDHRSLICFEVDWNNQSPEEAWKRLCRIDPALKEVGYLQTTYPVRYGEYDQPAYRYRFYCVADNGSGLLEYQTTFMVRSNFLYPFTFDVEADGCSYLKQWINPFKMFPNCEIHGRTYLSAYGEYRSRLKSGSLLETSAMEDATEEEWFRLMAIVDQVLGIKRSKKHQRRSRSQ